MSERIARIIAEAQEPCTNTLHYGCCRNGSRLTSAGHELAEALSPLWRDALEWHEDQTNHYHGND